MSALAINFTEWGLASGCIALFAAVCFIPVRRCPRGRYACPSCARLDTPAGEGEAREHFTRWETEPTVSREQS